MLDPWSIVSPLKRVSLPSISSVGPPAMTAGDPVAYESDLLCFQPSSLSGFTTSALRNLQIGINHPMPWQSGASGQILKRGANESRM